MTLLLSTAHTASLACVWRVWFQNANGRQPPRSPTLFRFVHVHTEQEHLCTLRPRRPPLTCAHNHTQPNAGGLSASGCAYFFSCSVFMTPVGARCPLAQRFCHRSCIALHCDRTVRATSQRAQRRRVCLSSAAGGGPANGREVQMSSQPSHWSVQVSLRAQMGDAVGAHAVLEKVFVSKCTNVWVVVVCMSGRHIWSIILYAQPMQGTGVLSSGSNSWSRTKLGCVLTSFLLKLAFTTPPSGGFLHDDSQSSGCDG